jgi:outer membrane protein insertion porin family
MLPRVPGLRRCVSGLFALLLGFPAVGASDEGAAATLRVAGIEFEGNRVTREAILRREVALRPGDVVDEAALEMARQAIMDLGLFREVRVERRDAEGGETVVFRVREKYYLFVLPRLSRSSDGDIRFGGELRFDNLLGLNQQLTLRAERERPDSGLSRQEDRLSVRYEVPRLIGSRYGLVVGMEHAETEKQPVDGGPDAAYREDQSRLELRLLRWLDPVRSRGWRVEGGLGWDYRDFVALGDTVVVPQEGLDAQLRLGVLYTDVSDYGVRRAGEEYGVRVGLPLKAFGSDYSYEQIDLEYRRYQPVWPLFGGGPANLNVRFRLGFASGQPFDDRAYSIGGAGGVRGYDREYREGERMAILNAEYLTPLFGYAPLRGVWFVDAGDVWEQGERPTTPLVSTGVGLRWHLRWFVRTDLRVDLAYAEQTGETRLYAGTNHSF